MAVCVGLSGIVLSGASYSESFSTVFRFAKGAETSVQEIATEDLDGRDPLPEYLGNASIFHGARGGGENGDLACKQLPVPDFTTQSFSQSMKHDSMLTTTRLLQRSHSRATL